MAKHSAGRVLVVDDQSQFVELLAADLEAQDYTVGTAESGEECLEKVTEFGPDVIVLDVKMPGMDGFETCFRLKEMPGVKHIPIIFLTGHNAEEGSAVATIAAGGADFLQKPYTPVILFSRVAAQVSASKKLRSFINAGMIDPDSGAYTHGAALDIIVRELARSKRTAEPAMAVVCAEIEALPPTTEPAARSAALVQAAKACMEKVGAPDAVAISQDALLVVMLARSHDGATAAAEELTVHMRAAGHPVSAGVSASARMPEDDLQKHAAGLIADARSAAALARVGGADKVVKA